ncbi:MAG: aminotransferase class V-fold PLP-dependent enzyme, partial [Patescibacteria group bacterium]|nr:aminotransferase class V-fold PLP-dependent enzyme [Patescibacteria group bacterium]
MFGKKRVYMDHASATLIDQRVAEAVVDALLRFPGNPSAPHAEGREARAAVSAARADVARSFSVKPEEILFTSGGTEANNIAIHGFLKALGERGVEHENMHVITTAIEHSSVLKTTQALEKKGIRVSYITPEKDGIVRPEMFVN